MKATLLKAVVCITLVFAGVLNANLSAGNKYVTNDEVSNGQVVSKTIYLHEGRLIRHMKYNFVYNEKGKMIEKEALKWNEEKDSWTPYYKIDFILSENEVTVELMTWNPKDKAYNLAKGRTIYKLNALETPVSYTSYKWNESSNSWIFVDNVSYEGNSNLYAITE